MTEQQRGREVWLLLDGEVTDPTTVAALWQRTPRPGGVRFRAVVNGLTPVERRLVGPNAAGSQRGLEAVVRILQRDAPPPSRPFTHFLNIIESVVVTEDSLDVEGVASPVVSSAEWTAIPGPAG